MRTRPPKADIINAALGLTGESGEFADLIKKAVYHDHEFDGACEELVTKKIIPMALETPDYEDDDERDDIAETCLHGKLSREASPCQI